MKNGSFVNKLQSCHYCNLTGFFCYTPSGADFHTCPCCGEYDFLSNECNYKTNEKYDFLYEDEYENDMRYIYKYCKYCKIIFELGCMHYNGGCTDNVFNCHFIKKWNHKVSNIVYDGMPIFDDEKDWFENVNNVEILTMYCPHKGHKCSKGIKNPINKTCTIY